MSNNSSGGTYFGVILFLGLIVLGFMWALDLGPFEKSYTPTTPYYAPSIVGAIHLLPVANTSAEGQIVIVPLKEVSWKQQV